MENYNSEEINSNKEEKKVTDQAFFEEAEKIVNRMLKQYDSLVELSKKYHVEDKDCNFMFNELKKYHESTKKAFKASDKDEGFSFKR